MASRVPEEQQLYARWLRLGARGALALLSAGFLVYVFEILEPHVPLRELPAIWSQPLERYRALTGAPSGWQWLGLLHHGDYVNFIGIVLLALMSAVCYARIVPMLLGRGDRLQAALAAAQVLVLAAAASGLLTAGH